MIDMLLIGTVVLYYPTVQYYTKFSSICTRFHYRVVVQSAASRRQSRTQALSLRTKDELIQFLHARFSLETRPVWHPGGRFWALRGSTACRRHGAEIRSPKSCDAAEWSAVQNNFAAICPSSSSSFYIARHHTIDNPTSHPHERDA